MTSLDAGMNVSASTAAPAKTLALVIGAGGGLGAALVQALSIPGEHGINSVLALGRATQPAIDYSEETSLQNAAAWVASQCQLQGAELRLLIVASGFLHGAAGQPERSWSQLNADYLSEVFRINAIGPALVMKHFLPLLPRQGRCVAGFVSAKVGSIGDNALGGWYGYRAAKAALNQLVKTAAIELKRRNPQALCVALHPGTVDTALSEPFAKAGLKLRPPDVAATELLTVLAALEPAQTGALVDYQGKVLPW
jgi:NAD(P)-dependent dehydrogenase (short-subunit alcohol dehydrogenase family)